MKTKHFIYKETGEIEEVENFLPPREKRSGFYISDSINECCSDAFETLSADTEFFKTRKKINEEMAFLIDLNESFALNLEEIRKYFKIPELEPEDDIELTSKNNDEDEALFSKSEYLDSYITKQKKKKIKKGIKWLLEQYNLPFNFEEWVQYYILYKQKPAWVPKYNWELLHQIIDDKSEALRIPLTTDEKKYIKQMFRKIFSMETGRPNKKLKKTYNKLLIELQKSKNKIRQSRTLENVPDILDKKNKTDFTHKINEKTGNITRRAQEYRDIARQIVNKKISKMNDKELNQLGEDWEFDEEDRITRNLRKQKERLAKRITLLFKSKPKK